jgi:GxxExxY protein
MEFHRSAVAERVIGCAIEVHKTVGPGLLESAYELCLAKEFRLTGLSYDIQVPVPVSYKGEDLKCGYRLDFVVENEVVVEVKSIERFVPVHKAQLITYLNLTGFPQGLLFNFNAPLLTAGIISVVNSRARPT